MSPRELATAPPPPSTTGAAASVRLLAIDDDALSAFVDQVGGSNLQVPEWAAVKVDWSADRVGWVDGNGRLVAAALVLHRRIPLGSTRLSPRRGLAYVPEGPVTLPGSDAPEPSALLETLMRFARSRGAFAVRVGPRAVERGWRAGTVRAAFSRGESDLDAVPPDVEDPQGARWVDALTSLGWTRCPRTLGDGQPWLVAVLDVAGRSREDLLGAMNQQWRRNVAKAAAAGVEVRRAVTATDLDAFEDLYTETAQRQGFTPRPRGYLTRMAATLGERARIDVAVHDGRVLAGAMTVRTGSRVCYVYGGSTGHERNVRAANALHWAITERVAAQGHAVYDLRGVEPGLLPTDPTSGLIRFKAGLGATTLQYVGEWERVLRPAWYRAYTAYRELQRRRSGGRR